MVILAWIGISLFGLALIVLIFGMTKPRMAEMSRETVIEASAESIFSYANNLKKFVQYWSPWTDKDPEMETIFEGEEEGIGAIYKWKGHPKKVGFGTMRITKVEEPNLVVSFLSFGGRGDAEVSVIIENIEENKTKVIWAYSSDSGSNPIARIFGSMMDKFLGPDFELGLKKLKEISEKNNL